MQTIARRMERGQPVSQLRERLLADIETSVQQVATRKASLPKVEYPQELPVSARRDEIAAALAKHQVVIVCGETGSGKTTQLPKICLELGRGVHGMIGHTQPRRIAARAVASRLSEELHTSLGQGVGYKVRFNDQVSESSHVKLMTDGILLSETQQDRYLNAYDTLIIDEAHERSLNIDFLLGFLKQLLPKRPDLKVVITSATIDPERFAEHFNDAPIIEVSGRTYPVELRYRPIVDEANERERDLQQAISEAVDELMREAMGDILVFLPGEREIRETAEALRKRQLRDTEILPLYARLSLAEQSRVFSGHRGRRIVLSTNVAETSLTVPGIRYVIDPGLARLSRYSHRSKVQRLPIEAISQASANQRSGRCGRVAAGVCIRLYSEEDFLARAEFTDAEILRTNLAAVILQMKALGFGDVEDFPFVDKPDDRLINDGFKLLAELQAVDDQRQLTKNGRLLARLPIDPRIGRMVVAGAEHGALREVLIIAAALSVQDPRERPLEARQAADQKHREFYDEDSDFLTWVNLWNWHEEQRQELSQNQLRKLCRKQFLSYMRLREWRDVHRQLLSVARDSLDARLNEEPADYQAVHKALLTGLLSNLGYLQEDKEFLGARGRRFSLFPNSTLNKKPPRWVMVAGLMETSRVFGMTAAKIQPEWVEAPAVHLLKHNYVEPHWQKRPAQVGAYENVTLYGLPIVSRRKVNYGPVNPEESRDLFIRQALVQGDFNCKAPFFAQNRKLIESIEELEHKSRRRDVLVDEQLIYDFYASRIPEGIYSGKRFDSWRRKAEAQEPRLLFLERDYLMQHSAEGVTQADFPDRLMIGELALALSYQFEPGKGEDGVTAKVPLALLRQLPPQRFDWLVPGLRRERVVELIRALPKSIRKNFVPAPNFADAALGQMLPEEGALIPALSRQLHRMTGIQVPDDAWAPQSLPDHLRMNFHVVDEKGKVIDQGRDLDLLQRRHGEAAAESLARLGSESIMPKAGTVEETLYKDWDFDELAEQRVVEKHGISLTLFPAIEDRGDAVALIVCDTPDLAAQTSYAGLRRLLRLRLARPLKDLARRLPDKQAMCLRYSRLPEKSGVKAQKANQACEELTDAIVDAVLQQVFLQMGIPRSKEAFNQRIEQQRSEIVGEGDRLCALLGESLSLYQSIASDLAGSIPLAWMQAVGDIREQLEHLIYRSFLSDIPAERLQHYPRYLKGLQRRLERLKHDPSRDRSLQMQIQPLWRQYQEKLAACEKQGKDTARLTRYRWLLEEYRISLFAQELKTLEPVSPKRLKAAWAEAIK